VASRSFFKALLLAIALSACGRTAVRASEKEFLADQVMVFDNDPHEADDHIMTNREGAAGGHGAGGGGCGCN
jgi:hypothetical protein